MSTPHTLCKASCRLRVLLTAGSVRLRSGLLGLCGRGRLFVCVSVWAGFRRCACPLSVCPLCPVPAVSAVACPSSRVSCPGVEILGVCVGLSGSALKDRLRSVT